MAVLLPPPLKLAEPRMAHKVGDEFFLATLGRPVSARPEGDFFRSLLITASGDTVLRTPPQTDTGLNARERARAQPNERDDDQGSFGILLGLRRSVALWRAPNAS